MTLSTYSGLKTAIADHLDRDDLTSQIDDFIDLAEARHRREIRIREMIQRATVTVSGRYLALPARFVQMDVLRLLTDPVTVLTEVNLHEMTRQRLATTGKPKFFTVHEEIEFDRSPDDSYTAEMIYYAYFQALSDSNTSNGLLARAPDAYLYGALIAAEPFLGEDERLPVWERLYTSARDGLKASDIRGRYAGPLVSRVVGATP